MMTNELEKTKSKYRYMILHQLCWAVLIVVPLFFHSSSDDWSVVWNRYARWGGNLFVYILVFYLNYLWIVPRYVLKKKDWKVFVFANILVIVGGLCLMDVWHLCSEHLLPDVSPVLPSVKP